MATTQNTFTGDGSNLGPFSFTFKWLEPTDIKVTVAGVLKTAGTHYNLQSLNYSTKTGGQVLFIAGNAPANGAAIVVYRQTDDSDLAATFYSGSAIRAQDLNNNFVQGLYVTQESSNNATTAIGTANTALTNSNTAISTANTALSTANTASSNASAAVATANTANTNASAAVSTANTANSNASAAVSTANTASSNASTALSTANTALSTANTANTNASTAISTANTASANASAAVSTANTASSNASAAVSTANTASSNASTALSTANTAISTANAAASAVANAILYDIVANVAAIPASPANNDAVEVTDSTGIESFTPLSGVPVGFVGNSGLSVRLVYTTTGSTWNWIQYFPNDPETRYLKLAGGTLTGDLTVANQGDIRLGESTANGTNYVAMQAPASLAANVTYTLPNADGTSGQLLSTNGSGTLSWATAAAGATDKIEEGNTSAEVIDTGSDGRFVVTTEGSERLRVTSAGLVGIGSNSPYSLLDLGTSLTGQKLSIYADATYRIGLGALPNEFRQYTHQGGFISWGHVSTSDQSTFTERARIDSSGRLLVGTSTSPSAGDGQYARLVVAGNTTGDAAFVSFQRNETSTAITSGERIARINFGDSSGNSFAVIDCDADANAGSGDYPGRLVFSTTADGASSPTERMRIDSNGFVNIGAYTIPSSTPGMQLYGAGNLIFCKRSDTGEAISFFANSTTKVGNIVLGASSTTYNTSSDYRLKENIVPLTGAADRLKRLPVHRFNFIVEPDKAVDGFLAHEAQAVVPECVTGIKDEVDADGNPIYQGIDQSKLVPLLTAALQEAIGEIESLKARVAAIESA